MKGHLKFFICKPISEINCRLNKFLLERLRASEISGKLRLGRYKIPEKISEHKLCSEQISAVCDSPAVSSLKNHLHIYKYPNENILNIAHYLQKAIATVAKTK